MDQLRSPEYVPDGPKDPTRALGELSIADFYRSPDSVVNGTYILAGEPPTGLRVHKQELGIPIFDGVDITNTTGRIIPEDYYD